MSEFLMNGNGTINHDSGSTISGGIFTIISVPSFKVKGGGAGFYFGDLLYTFAGGNAAGFAPGSVLTVAPQSIKPTSKKVKIEGSAPVREGDGGTMAAIGTVVPPAIPPTAPISGPVIVDSAGQYKVIGE